MIHKKCISSDALGDREYINVKTISNGYYRLHEWYIVVNARSASPHMVKIWRGVLVEMIRSVSVDAAGAAALILQSRHYRYMVYPAASQASTTMS